MKMPDEGVKSSSAIPRAFPVRRIDLSDTSCIAPVKNSLDIFISLYASDYVLSRVNRHGFDGLATTIDLTDSIDF